MIRAVPYSPEKRTEWCDHNRNARNGLFLFDRGFMDYHSERFSDASLMIYDEDQLVAIFPANVRSGTVYSHQGLTFGGLVFASGVGAELSLSIFGEVLRFFQSTGCSRLVYKPIPWIYPSAPSQEDLYALFRHGATLVRRDVTTTIDYRAPGGFSSRRRRGIRKSQRAGLTVSQTHRWADYWEMLTRLLQERHGAKPTHSLDEITLLAARFPDNIKLFTAQGAGPPEGEVVAGVVIFESRFVAHAQYIAAAPAGREVGALDAVFEHVIMRFQHEKRYFDFGISNEEDGRVLNCGLVKQKEEFGGTSVVHELYALPLQAS